MMKIEFYHIDAMEAPNYEPIWKALVELGVDASLVAVPQDRNTAGAWFDFETLSQYYKERNVPFKTTIDASSVGITTQNKDILRDYRSLQLRLMYGPGVYPLAWGLSEKAARPFDAILVHGPRYVDMLSRWQPREHLLDIGYPKYDALFAGSLNLEEIRTSWHVSPSKPIVLYLPTWEQNSSLDKFIDAVGSLTSEYNVIVKPHHCTVRMEPNRMEALRRTGVSVSLNSYDLVDLFAIADVVLSDARSSSLCESLMTDRKTIGMVADPREMENWIKPTGLVAVSSFCTDPRQLQAHVARIMDQDEFAEARKAWSDQYVSSRDGSAGRKAARLLVEHLDRRLSRAKISVPVNETTMSARVSSSAFDPANENVQLSMERRDNHDRKPKVAPSQSNAVTNVSPLVSVVLPTYNHLRFLPLVIESVLKQTYSNFELIVVNDGSTDGTREFLDRLKHPLLKVVHQNNARLPKALNAGFNVARGDLLTWISSDNWCAPTFLEALVGALVANPEAGFAFSAFAWIDERGNLKGIQRNQDLSLHNLLCANPGIASFMYRRECHEKLGFYDPELEGAEDWEMWLRICEHYDAVYVPEVVYYYRVHHDTMTVRMSEKVRDACKRTIAKVVHGNGAPADIGRFYPTLAKCREKGKARFEAWFDLGTSLLQSPFDQAATAIAFLEEALKLSSSNPGVALNLAVAYGRSGRFDEARRIAKSMRRLGSSPDLQKAFNNLVLAAKQRKKDPFDKMQLLAIDRKRSELFTTEAQRRRVFSSTIPQGEAQASRDAGKQAHSVHDDRETRETDAVESIGNTAASLKPDRLSITYLINNILGVTGGNQTLLQQVNALAARGHTLTIVTNSDRPAWFNINARVVKVPTDRRLSDFVPPSDVVVSTYFINTPELQRITASAKIYFAQGDQFIFEDSTKKKTRDPLQKQFMALSKASYLAKGVFFVPNSNNLAESVRRKYGRKADAVLPISIDTRVFHPIQKSPRTAGTRILVVGPDIEGSEIEPLLFKGIKDIRRALDILSKKRGDFTVARMSNSQPSIFSDFPCEFHIAPSDEMKTRIYGSSDILVYASHYDSCPLPPMEAMAAGVAVVCTATPGAMEYCRDKENSLLVPIKSPERIARAIEDLMDDKDLRDRLIRNGVWTSKHYTKEAEWNNLERIFYEVLSKQRSHDGGSRTLGESKMAPDFVAGNHNASDDYAEAFHQIENHEFEKASETLRLAIDHHKSEDGWADAENQKVLNLAGKVALVLKRYNEARGYFNEQLANDVSSSSAFEGLGEVYFAMGDLKNSQTMLERALASDATNEEARLFLAKVDAEAGNSHWTQIELLLHEGVRHFRNGKFEQALASASESERLYSQDSVVSSVEYEEDLFNLKGSIFLGMSKLDEAKNWFERALAIQPGSSGACAGLGEVFYLAGLDEQAKTMFPWSLKGEPQNTIARAGLAKTNQNLGMPQDHDSLQAQGSVESAEDQISLGPSRRSQPKFEHHLLEANRLFYDRRFDEALAEANTSEELYAAESALTSTEYEEDLFNTKGSIYLGMNNLEEARRWYEQALQVQPQSSVACVGLGEVFYLAEYDEQSKQMFEWAVRADPENAAAREGLAKVNKNLGLEVIPIALQVESTSVPADIQ